MEGAGAMAGAGAGAGDVTLDRENLLQICKLYWKKSTRVPVRYPMYLAGTARLIYLFSKP